MPKSGHYLGRNPLELSPTFSKKPNTTLAFFPDQRTQTSKINFLLPDSDSSAHAPIVTTAA